MTKSIVITKPSEKVLKLFDLMREHKECQLDKMARMEKGLFSIKV